MIQFDFSDLPLAFANHSRLRVARHQGVTFDDGIGSDIGWSIVELQDVAVFPMSPRELEALEEGGKERGGISIYSKAPLRGVQPHTSGTRADVVEWDGTLWQVTQVHNWGPSGKLYNTKAIRMDRSETTIVAYIASEVAA